MMSRELPSPSGRPRAWPGPCASPVAEPLVLGRILLALHNVDP